MSRELARTPLIIKTIAFIMLLLGIALIYLVSTSSELMGAHRTIGYVLGLALLIIPGYILIANVIE